MHDWLVEEFKRQRVIEGKYLKEYEIVGKSEWGDPYRRQKALPRKIDLLIFADDADYICEFKTEFNAESIEKAVGQLMIYEKLYERECSRPIKKVAVFYCEDLAEESIERLAGPGSVMWEMRMERRESIYEVAEVLEELGITLYLYIGGTFYKVSPKEGTKREVP